MTDPDELMLKAEIDEIMKSVDSIMTKVETVMPAKQEDAQPQNDGRNIS
jgi:tetrahydromethanopterin S-methyltransferase subunit G